LGEQVHTELDIETFRHHQLRQLVHEKSKTNTSDRRKITQARLTTCVDIVHLTEGKNAYMRTQEEKSKKAKLVKKKVAKKLLVESSKSEGWHDEDESTESFSFESEAEGEDIMEDVIVVVPRE
jgi:hypothetical protein